MDWVCQFPETVYQMLKAVLQIESKCQFLSAIGREDTCDFRMKCPAVEMKQERRIMILKIVIQLLWLELLELRPNKIMLLFLEIRVTRKIVTRAAAIFLKVFDWLSGNILFSSLVSFDFFIPVFCCCCCCCCCLFVAFWT